MSEKTLFLDVVDPCEVAVKFYKDHRYNGELIVRSTTAFGSPMTTIFRMTPAGGVICVFAQCG